MGQNEEIQSILDEKCFVTQNNYSDHITKTKIFHGLVPVIQGVLIWSLHSSDLKSS